MPCPRGNVAFAISAAGNVPNVKIKRGCNISITRLTNGRAKSNSWRVGVRPPGVRQNTIGTNDTIMRDIPIAANILSINSPAAPDNIWPFKSSSPPGTSVTITNPFGFFAICGKTTFVAPARNGWLNSEIMRHNASISVGRAAMAVAVSTDTDCCGAIGGTIAVCVRPATFVFSADLPADALFTFTDIGASVNSQRTPDNTKSFISKSVIKPFPLIFQTFCSRIGHE